MSYSGSLSKELVAREIRKFWAFFIVGSVLLLFLLYNYDLHKNDLLLGFLFFVSGMQSLFFDFRKNSNPSNIPIQLGDFPRYLDYLEKTFPIFTTGFGLLVFLQQLIQETH